MFPRKINDHDPKYLFHSSPPIDLWLWTATKKSLELDIRKTCPDAWVDHILEKESMASFFFFYNRVCVSVPFFFLIINLFILFVYLFVLAALAGRFLTTAPPGKSLWHPFYKGPESAAPCGHASSKANQQFSDCNICSLIEDGMSGTTRSRTCRGVERPECLAVWALAQLLGKGIFSPPSHPCCCLSSHPTPPTTTATEPEAAWSVGKESKARAHPAALVKAQVVFCHRFSPVPF